MKQTVHSAQAAAPMVAGPIGKTMVSFAMPLFFGNLFQQLYNTADALIVGKILGDSALAAVTSTSSLIFLMVGFFQGLSMGAGVLIAQHCGAGRRTEARAAIHTSLLTGLLAGVFLTLLGVFGTPVFLRWMGTPAGVLPRTAAYLRIYFAGGIGLVLYNVCMGIMQALGDSRHPLYYLIIAAAINVPLDILFIAVFQMDVGGAAFATILSQFFSAGLCLRRLIHKEKTYPVRLRELRIDGASLRLIIRYGLPAGLQNSVISIANVVAQSHINAFGEAAMAGCGAYSKIEGFAFLPITSFTAALTTFVGQNLGAGELDRVRKGARFGIICSLAIAEIIGVVIFLLAPVLIGAFAESPDSIAYGVTWMRICAPFFFLLATTHCLAATLRGAGKAVVPMLTMFACWCLFRMSFLTLVSPRFQTIAAVSCVYPLTWCMSTVVLVVYYRRADWIHALERSGLAAQ